MPLYIGASVFSLVSSTGAAVTAVTAESARMKDLKRAIAYNERLFGKSEGLRTWEWGRKVNEEYLLGLRELMVMRMSKGIFEAISPVLIYYGQPAI